MARKKLERIRQVDGYRCDNEDCSMASNEVEVELADRPTSHGWFGIQFGEHTWYVCSPTCGIELIPRIYGGIDPPIILASMPF